MDFFSLVKIQYTNITDVTLSKSFTVTFCYIKDPEVKI